MGERKVEENRRKWTMEEKISKMTRQKIKSVKIEF